MISKSAQNLHEFESTELIAQTYFGMGKRSRKDLGNVEQKVNGNGDIKKAISLADEAVDPSLALLFSSSVSATFAYY